MSEETKGGWYLVSVKWPCSALRSYLKAIQSFSRIGLARLKPGRSQGALRWPGTPRCRCSSLNLVVKYGPHVRAVEGQALWVIEHFTDVRAPIYTAGSRMETRCFFIWTWWMMSLWSEDGRKCEKIDVAHQLQRMLASMRALQWNETYIGPSRHPFDSLTLTEFSRIPWTHSVSWRVIRELPRS